MAAKYSYMLLIGTCFILALTGVSAQGLQTVNGKIKVTIGTMSGCPFAANFITTQLTEAYSLYGEFLDIEFVPWGRTTWDSERGFVCWFGVNDCFANRLQRCALNMLEDQDARVKYMACEFVTPFPSWLQSSYQCAHNAGLNLVDLDYCVTHPGDDLDRTAQTAAAGPMSVINGIPYIVFNDVIDINLHREAQSQGRFRSMICFALAADPSTGITSCTI